MQLHMRHGSIARPALQDDVRHLTGSSDGAATAERVFLAAGSHPLDSRPYPSACAVGITAESCLPAQVHMRQGSIAKLALQNNQWHITGSNGAAASAERVFLATGSHPSDSQPYPGPEVIGLDDALIPSKLKGAPCPPDI